MDDKILNLALSCIRCDKELENIMNDDSNQPYAGTTFISYGHYGSTVFDPMNGTTFLELNICDECLTALAAKKLVLEGERTVFDVEDEDYIGPYATYSTWER